MTPKFPGDSRSWRAGTGRGLCCAVLSCLALAASACGGELTFSSAQTSFRNFSECAVIEDVRVRGVRLKGAWLQNIVAAPRQGARSGFQKSADAYVVTVAQAAPGGGPPKDNLASLRVGAEQSADQRSSPTETGDEAYVVTGVIRAAVDDGPQRDDFTVLLVRKVLDEYKVVSWATNVGRKQEERKRLPALLEELRSKPYRGRCSW